MAICTFPSLAPSTAYKHKCRCARCRLWKTEAANRTNNKELAKRRSQEWRLNNIEKSRQNAKTYQEKHPEKVLEWQLKKYKISLEDYRSLLKKQHDVCAICKQTCIYKSRLSIDHCHTTDKVRGLLCGNCNTGLGKFKESEDFLLKAIQYIKQNGDIYD